MIVFLQTAYVLCVDMLHCLTDRKCGMADDNTNNSPDQGSLEAQGAEITENTIDNLDALSYEE